MPPRAGARFPRCSVARAGGAPLPGWIVTLAHATGATATTASDGAGQYRFDNIPPGAYKVWVTLPPAWRAISPQPVLIDLVQAAACAPVDFWSVREREDRSVPTPPR